MNKAATFFRESMLARFFIPAGLIFMVVGIIILIINIKNSNYIETEAVVSKTELAQEAYTDEDGNYVDATYKVYVKYTVDGKEYETELGELSGYKEGKKLTIYYNPSDPNQITQSKSLILPLIMIIAGIASLVAGIMSGVNSIKRYNKMKEQEKGWANNE